MEAKDLADEPLDPVAAHRPAQLAADHDGQPRALPGLDFRPRPEPVPDDDVGRDDLPALLENGVDLAAPPETVPRAEPKSLFRQMTGMSFQRPLRRRLLSTFLPPAVRIRARNPIFFERFLRLGR